MLQSSSSYFFVELFSFLISTKSQDSSNPSVEDPFTWIINARDGNSHKVQPEQVLRTVGFDEVSVCTSNPGWSFDQRRSALSDGEQFRRLKSPTTEPHCGRVRVEELGISATAAIIILVILYP
jgi:hypothetical protein